MNIHQALLLVSGALLAACQTSQVTTGEDSKSELVGPEWEVKAVHGDAVLEASRITLHFTDAGKVHGRAGCNLYDGSYQLTGERLTINVLSQTRMVCEPSVMAQEQSVLDTLQSIKRFRIDEAGALVLEGADTQTLEAYRL